MRLFTVSGISFAAQKIQRSEFIAWLYPAQDVDQARELIAAHNKAHADATHNCYAYVIGFGQETQYYSDAGEPSGTAGKPMLNALLSAAMTNVLAIVTRHYGGIKLGVRGLIEAYHDSVKAAIGQASLIPALKMTEYDISLDYALADPVQNKLLKLGGKIILADYQTRVRLIISLPESQREDFEQFLNGHVQQNRLDYQEKREDT